MHSYPKLPKLAFMLSARYFLLILGIILNLCYFPSLCFSNSGEDSTGLELTLNQAVEIALQKNLSLQNADYNRQISKAGLKISKDPFLPKLSTALRSDWDRQENAGSSTDEYKRITSSVEVSQSIIPTGGEISLVSNISHDDYRYFGLSGREVTGNYSHSFGLQIDQPLLRNAGHVKHYPVTESELDYQNIVYDYQLSRELLISQVSSAFYRAVNAQQLVNINRTALEEAETHLQHTRIKLEEGLVAQIDVSQAELQSSQKENLVITAQQDAEDTLDALKLLLNVNLDESIQLATDVTYHPETIDEDNALSEALANRLEIKKAENGLRAAELNVKRSFNARLPDLNLGFSAEINNSDIRKEDLWVTDQPDYNFNISLKYTFGRRTERQQYLQSKLIRRRQENSLLELKQEISSQVRSSIRRYRSLKRTIELLGNSVRLAEYALDLANKSYAEGLIRNIDLLKAQDELLLEQTNYISRLMDFEISKISILRVLGRPINPSNVRLNPVENNSNQPGTISVEEPGK